MARKISCEMSMSFRSLVLASLAALSLAACTTTGERLSGPCARASPPRARELQESVMAELGWEPSINAAHIGVAAHAGVVTLTGHVPKLPAKGRGGEDGGSGEGCEGRGRGNRGQASL